MCSQMCMLIALGSAFRVASELSFVYMIMYPTMHATLHLLLNMCYTRTHIFIFHGYVHEPFSFVFGLLQGARVELYPAPSCLCFYHDINADMDTNQNSIKLHPPTSQPKFHQTIALNKYRSTLPPSSLHHSLHRCRKQNRNQKPVHTH